MPSTARSEPEVVQNVEVRGVGSQGLAEGFLRSIIKLTFGIAKADRKTKMWVFSRFLFERAKHMYSRFAVAREDEGLGLQHLRNGFALIGRWQMVQVCQGSSTVFPFHTHIGELQVRVHMMRVNGHHAPETFLCFFEIAGRKVVVAEIVQYSGRPRCDL